MSDDTSVWFDKYPGLAFERRDHGVLWMTINRPDKYNATDAQLHKGLSEVWLDIDADDETSVVVVTGAGRPSPRVVIWNGFRDSPGINGRCWR